MLAREARWDGMRRDVYAFVAACPTCIRISEAGAVNAPISAFRTTSAPFELVALDFVGRIPVKKGAAEKIY